MNNLVGLVRNEVGEMTNDLISQTQVSTKEMIGWNQISKSRFSGQQAQPWRRKETEIGARKKVWWFILYHLMHISWFIDTLGTKRCKRTENNDKRNTRRQKKNEKNFAMLFVKSMEFNGVQPQETQVQLKNWKTRWQVMLPKKSTTRQELKRNENEGWERNKIRYRKAWRNFSFIEYTLQSAIGTQHPQLPSPHLCYGINEKADSLVFLPHFWVRSSIAKCSVDPVPWTPSPSKPKRRIDRKKLWNT